ncbi:hydroxymethylbilane synthase, partial [Tessaracoccus lubricantis]
MRLRLGTRGSALAVAQSELVADALRSRGHEVELVRIRTVGDVERGSLTQVGGLGVFAAELRTALLAGDCDFAVHSLKDLPTAPVPGLVIAAIPARADARDALCARDGLTLA